MGVISDGPLPVPRVVPDTLVVAGQPNTDAGPGEPLRVLIVDDSALDAELQFRTMNAAGLAVQARFAVRESEYRAALAEFAPDVVLCDFSFADFDGMTVLRIVRELAPGTPVILVSETLTEERVGIAVRNGAVDYVLKANLRRLPDAVKRAVAEARERVGRRIAEAGLQRMSRVRDLLSAVNSAIVRIEEPAVLFREACRVATSVGGFPLAIVATIDPVARTGRIEALIGDVPGDLAARRIAESAGDIGRASGPVAQSMREQRPIVVNDVESPSSIVPQAAVLLAAGVRSLASFPFVADGKLGALLLGASERDFFSQDEVELVCGLTNNLSFALELASKRKLVEYLSYYDPLTELPNRKLFHERLRHEVAAAARRRERLALLVFDIAQLASVNTTFGEWAGDAVLRTVAQRLTARTDPSLVGRIAGDRFAILIPGLRSARDVMPELSVGGLALLGAPIVLGEREMPITAHVGCALFPDDGADGDELFRNAQGALQRARAEGVPYRFSAPELHAQFVRRLDLEERLKRAVADREFLLYYQPKVDLTTRAIVGVEALMRWRDPEQPDSPVLPSDFIPVLEQSGLIVEVGRWALGEAVRQHHAWLKAGLVAPRISVNVASVQLRGPSLVDDVREALAIHPGEAGIDLEVTESGIMGNVAEAIQTLRKIRELGVEIAIDDFGTGYSSLSYLFQLPLSTLKIDRSFIDGMTDQVDKMTLVSTVISLGRELKLKVVAEGVETEEQAQLLRLLRCDQMQGFLIARPLVPGELEPMLARRPGGSS